MQRKTVDTLILDLDNTIFDWFALWHASFEPIYSEILALSGENEDVAQAAIREVHQRRRTSEYSFLIDELSILKKLGNAEEIRAKFYAALEKSRIARDKRLKLYPSVFRSLWDIKKRGTKIVAYTESMAFYSAYRLKRFGLDGVIDVLFSPADHDMPAGISVDSMRRLPDDFYQLSVTEIKHTPSGELKPNASILLDIIKTIGTTPAKCVYVGDSLFKDVAMAREVGVFDVHAQYGESQRKPEYDLLRKVSHWTQEDVEREKAITEKGHKFTPTAVLKENFAELFIYCDFGKFETENTILPATDEAKNAVEIWKKSIDVQQHFNDLEMRIRNIAITVVGALLAAVSFTYQQGLELEFFGIKVPAGLGFVAGAIFAWGGFFLMDRYWYHVLLKGAVSHATKIEKHYENLIPKIGLTQTISSESQNVKILFRQTNSIRRLNYFYLTGLIMLLSVVYFLFYAKPIAKTASNTSTFISINERQDDKGKR